MSFNFPQSPILDQQFTAPNGIVYQWIGAKWVGIKISSSSSVFPSFGQTTFLFPSAPTINQQYIGPNNLIYRWDSTKWIALKYDGDNSFYPDNQGGTIQFPSSPPAGYSYEAPNNIIYEWDGIKWTGKTFIDTTPIYSISPQSTSISEGQAVTFYVTVEKTNATQLRWNLSSAAGVTATTQDFVSSSGIVDLSNFTGTFQVSVKTDTIADSGEKFAISLFDYNDVNYSTPLATSSLITISQTEIPTYSVTAATPAVEFSTDISVQIFTTNVPDATVLYWRVKHITTNAADFETTAGAITISGNYGGFAIGTISDGYEGDESFSVEISDSNTFQNILATSNTVVITEQLGADTTPDAFSFTPVTNAQLGALTPSSEIIVTGFTPGITVPVSVSAGGGVSVRTDTTVATSAFATSHNVIASSAGSIRVTARLTSSSSNETATSVTVTIGGVSADFTVTTLAAAAPTYSFTRSVASVNEGGSFTITFNTNQGGSFPYTISGISTGDIGVSSLTGTVSNGTVLTFSVANDATTEGAETFSIALDNGQASATVTINDTSTTPVNTTPTSFPDFTTITGKELSTVYDSEEITVSGMDPGVGVSVSTSGGSVAAGTSSAGTTFSSTSRLVTTDTSGSIKVKARVTSSSSYSANASVTVTVGGVSKTFTVTTRAVNTTPTSFPDFAPFTDKELMTVYNGDEITVSGMDPGVSVSVSASGGYVFAGTSSAGTTYWGNAQNVTTDASGSIKVRPRVTSSSSYSTNTSVTVTVGGVSKTFTVTTKAYVAPAGYEVFTTNGTFTVPAGHTKVAVVVMGAGASGSDFRNTGGQGGLANAIVTGLAPGDQISVTVGKGGDGGADVTAGGSSSFGSYVTATGGGVTTGDYSDWYQGADTDTVDPRPRGPSGIAAYSSSGSVTTSPGQIALQTTFVHLKYTAGKGESYWSQVTVGGTTKDANSGTPITYWKASGGAGGYHGGGGAGGGNNPGGSVPLGGSAYTGTLSREAGLNGTLSSGSRGGGPAGYHGLGQYGPGDGSGGGGGGGVVVSWGYD